MERLGVAFAGGGLNPTEVVECFQLAEELGYESAWMAEGHAGDQFSILTACALATKKILLGTSISSVFVRSAPTIAMAATCVDHFSGGRFILGLGSGHKIQVEPDHGLDYSQPLQRLRECVDIVRILLRDGEVSYKGSVFDIKHFAMGIEPVRKEIPIYLGAVAPKMLEICGEISQGSLGVWSTLDHARGAAEHVAAGARRAGRDPKEVDVATMIPCAVSEDRDKARDAMRYQAAMYAGKFPRYHRMMAQGGFTEELEAVRVAWGNGDIDRAMQLVPTGLIDQHSVSGRPEECRQGLEEYRKAGVTLPVIFPATGGKDAKKQAMEIIRACAPQ